MATSLQVLMILLTYIGISMSSCIMGKSDSYEDEDQVVQRLDGIYQVGDLHVSTVTILSIPITC